MYINNTSNSGFLNLTINKEKKEIKKYSFKRALKDFFSTLMKNQLLFYTYTVTILLIFFYLIVIMIFGHSEGFPVPFEIPNIQGVVFILLIGFSFYLLFLFVISLNSKTYQFIQNKNSIQKLFGLHIVFIFISVFIPIAIFIGVYLIAFFIWYIISSALLVLFAQDISLRISRRSIIKNGNKSMIFYVIFWIISILIFGAFFIFIDIKSLEFNQQMIFLVFPLFQLLLPVLGLIIKSKSGNRAPVTLFGALIFIFVLYHWLRYFLWDPNLGKYTIFDGIVDIVLISYTFFALFKNARKISSTFKIHIEPLLFLFIWTRISSMILLLAVGDYGLFGYTASEGSYLLSMFLTIIVGTILGLFWIRRGIKEKDLDSEITLPTAR